VVEFRFLGPLEAVVEGVPVELGAPQQRAVLALLLLNANEVVSRDRIVDELWGERPPATAAKLVQLYVSALRKLLDPDRSLLITRAPGYVLRVEPDALDLHRFERLVGQGRAELAEGSAATAGERFREALALWRGPALADLAFAPFAQAEIARLEERRLDAVCDRIEADLALGGSGVVGELEALIAEHPLRERLRGQLMLALYRSGRQAEALAAYQDARRALVDGLGIEPGRELRELEQAILRQDPGLDLAPPGEPELGPARNAFVGREHELSTLMAALDEALAGEGRLVLIAGEPGIGKSRLAEEVGRHARRRGARVYVGRCWEAGGAPAYWPWVQALRAYIRDSDPEAVRAQLGGEGAELATILPELRGLVPDLPESPPADSDGARFRLLESVASFLRNAASAGPVVVGLDDLHAADAPSLLLLRFVAGQLAAAPILIVGCYRDTEVGPELSETLADVARDPGMQRLALRGLSGSDTSRLLHLTMGDAPADELAAAIHADTQGNPLFAKEIGRLLAAEGHGDGAPGGIPIPQGVLEVIGQRLARQSESCRNLLALASVVGREFDPDVIGSLAEVDEDALFAALDEAAGAGLVGAVPEASGRLRFSHILIRDALYEDLPAPRRLRLHPRRRRGARGAVRPQSGAARDRARAALSRRRSRCGAQGDRVRPARRGPGRVAVRLRGGGRVLRERAGDARDGARGRLGPNLRAAALPRRGAEPGGQRSGGAAGAAQGGRARAGGRPARPAGAGGNRIRWALRLGAGEHRSLLRPGAGTCPGGRGNGGQQRSRPPARPPRRGATR